MASPISETLPKFTAETLRWAAKQSQRCLVVPVRLRRAIKRYLREQEEPHMKRKVLSLTQSFNEIKEINLMLPESTSKELFEDPMKFIDSKRWKITSSYGDVGLKYRDDETIAYVASRMPAVYSACYRVLSEIRRRLPGFSPARVLDFGAGTGSAMWALREVWPKSLERINLVEPSQSMQRAGQNLLQDLKNLPLIHSYGSIQALTQKISKSEREHDLVIAVLVEPGTPQGAGIISQVRSHILWMEKRKCRKLEGGSNETSKDLMLLKRGAYIVAPCPHDGACPLDNTGKYCHFVQRLERTTSQRAYKRSKGEPLRGFEDEKFCYVVFRRGQRPRGPWPLDGMKFETLKEQLAKRNPEDLEIDFEDQFVTEEDGEPYEYDPASYDSDTPESAAVPDSNEELEGEEEKGHADLGNGWGRIIYTPMRRGKRIEMDVCRASNRDGLEGVFKRIVVTQSKNPTLHHQARRSLWGDLWPF